MDQTTDSSVLMNLKDLFVMEADRRVDEAAAVERAKAEEIARVERERREQEEAIRAAREDERHRAALALRAQNDAVEARIETWRADLERVREDRERTRLEMAAMVVPGDKPSRRGNWIAGGMAAMSLVAALTATFVAWPQPMPPQPTVSPVATTVIDAPVEVPEAPEPALVVATPDPVEVAVTPEPAPVARPRHPRRPRHARPQPPADDLGAQLDFGNDNGLIPE